MIRKKILLLVLTVITTSSIFISCGVSNNLTDEQKIEVLNEIKMYEVNGDNTLDKLEKLILKNIDSYKEDDKDIMIDVYISQLYQTVDSLNTKIGVLGYELEEVVKKYEVKVSDENTYRKIPKEYGTIKGFLDEVLSKGFILELDENTKTYTIQMNTKNILEKFGPKASPSLKAYLELNVYEEGNGVVGDTEKQTVDLKEVVKRINMIEKGIELDKKQDYDHINKWVSSMRYYYGILFGLSHDFFESTELIKEDILKEYESIIKENENSQVSKILEEGVKLIKDNNKKITPEIKTKMAQMLDNNLITDEIRQRLQENQTNENMINQIQESLNNKDNINKENNEENKDSKK